MSNEINYGIIKFRAWNKCNKDRLNNKLSKIDFSQLYSNKNYNSNSFCDSFTSKIVDYDKCVSLIEESQEC
jgi:hypothetical protein